MQRIGALLVIKGGCWLMALVCAFAVLRVAFT
jgi:hypothetical protein